MILNITNKKTRLLSGEWNTDNNIALFLGQYIKIENSNGYVLDWTVFNSPKLRVVYMR